MLNEPEIITHGFVSPADAEDIVPAARKKIIEVVNRGGEDIQKSIIAAVRSHLYNETRRRPMVFVTVTRA
jgi:mRNA degradation ribonuclease J1/J2